LLPAQVLVLLLLLPTVVLLLLLLLLLWGCKSSGSRRCAIRRHP
jgi:hypothetical protein